MSTTRHPFVRDHVAAEEYEPFLVGEQQAGEIRWLRTEGSAGNALAAGLWRSSEATYDYVFPGDETFHVVRGRAVIELTDSGDRVTVREGDIASFDAGTRSVWHIEEPFVKFTVVGGGGAPPPPTARRSTAGYDAPDAYVELVEPRYQPIADRLVRAARPGARDRVLELGAGTGLVSRRIADHAGYLLATDLSADMLERARRSIPAPTVTFALVDYTRPLPFLDASFDLVVCGLTFVQDERERVREVARVLRPGGRVAFVMWGSSYQELDLLSEALESIGRPRIPPPSPGRAVRRLEAAGFQNVTRRDHDLVSDFADVDDYLEYRRAFGRPAGAPAPLDRRYFGAVERRARLAARVDGTFALGWSVSVITGALEA